MLSRCGQPFLAAGSVPGRGQLRIEVVGGRPLGGTLVDEILAGALAGAGVSEVPGVLRFDHARVSVVDRVPALYRRAARVVTELLESDLAARSEAALGKRTALLWRTDDRLGFLSWRDHKLGARWTH